MIRAHADRGGPCDPALLGELTRPVADDATIAQQWATLKWAEDIGRASTHSSRALNLSAWRLLGAALIPSPEHVVVSVSYTVINPGMECRLPVRFRHRNQSARTTIEQLSARGLNAVTPVRGSVRRGDAPARHWAASATAQPAAGP